jgi:hypothetical protein
VVRVAQLCDLTIPIPQSPCSHTPVPTILRTMLQTHPPASAGSGASPADMGLAFRCSASRREGQGKPGHSEDLSAWILAKHRIRESSLGLTTLQSSHMMLAKCLSVPVMFAGRLELVGLVWVSYPRFSCPERVG